MKERVKHLKNKRISSWDDRYHFIERFILFKRAEEKYRGETDVIKYTHIINEILSNMSIVVDKDDLIVGRVKQTIPTAEEEKFLPPLRPPLGEEYKMTSKLGLYAKSHHFYSEKKINENEISEFPITSAPLDLRFRTTGHITLSWRLLLKKGMKGIKENAQNKLKEIKDNDPKSVREREFLQAVVISCDAVMSLARRYAEEVRRLAQLEVNEGRRNELIKIAGICEKVPAQPARSFHEGLQSIWFIDLIMHKVIQSRDYNLGRMDQYLYPLYKKDIESGVMTREDALELIECFFIKCNEITSFGDQGYLNYPSVFSPVEGTGEIYRREEPVDSVQYLITGGQTINGKCVCNDLSFLILDAVDEVRMKQPNLFVRYFPGINRKFWLKVCDVMRRGIGNIGLLNDEVLIPAFINGGVSKEDAVDYVQIGCSNPAIPGKDAQLREYHINLAKDLVFALNDGFSPMAKVQCGPHTGKIDSFKSFEDLIYAFKRQLEHDVANAVEYAGAFYRDKFKAQPFSFESILIDGCVDRAIDCNDPYRNPCWGGPGYIHLNFYFLGIATAADSLAAIKKVVYDDRQITLRELRDILNNNFKGHERLRLKLLNRCPKYGNDDDYVDSIAREIGLVATNAVLKQRNADAGLCWPGFYSYHRYKMMGLETEATPDGRKAGDDLSENFSPTHGCDTRGPTAALNSMVKLPFKLTPGGGTVFHINPTVLIGVTGVKILSSLIETYFKKGGHSIQLNIIDKETLIDAKKHPEKHRDLIIRVTGYSGYFITLSPETQDNVIARCDHRI